MKKIISIILAVLMILPSVSFASGSDELVLRTVVNDDFEDDSVGSLPKPFGGWKHSTAVRSVDEFDGGKSLHMKTYYDPSLSSNPDNVLEIKRNFEGRWIIDFDVYIKEADQLYFALKEQVNNKAWMRGVQIIGTTPSIWINNVYTTLHDETIAHGTWLNVTIELDSEANRYSLSIDGKAYVDNDMPESGFDYSNVSLRVQAYGRTKGATTDVYIDNFTAKKYDTAPVITLKGEESVSVIVGEQYTDPGFEATDPIDGDITDDVTVTGEVDTSKEGEYILSYDVTASDGVSAETVYRTVTVSKKQIVRDADVSADSELEDYPAANATDGNAATAWKSDSDNAQITLDFGKELLLETITLHSDGISDAYVLSTTDGSTWQREDFEVDIQTGSVIMTSEVFAASAIKLCLSGSDMTVYEIEADTNDSSVADFIMGLVEDSMPSNDMKISSDIELKANYGFGAAVTWHSSNEAVISNDGKVTLPADETEVTLTATVVYADSEKQLSFGPYTVKSKNDGMRVKISENMESTSIGSVPSSASGWWASNGATAGVVSHGGSKALRLYGLFEGDKNPDATIEYGISNISNPKISFDFSIENPGKAFQALIKDVTNSRIIVFAAVEDGDLKLCSQSVGEAIPGETYTVELEFNNSAKTVNAYLNGELKLGNHQFVSAETAWDTSNMVWRFQVYNHTKGSEMSAYVDNFSIFTSSFPTITLNGDSEMTIVAGSEFEDPGATAHDAIDGDITDSIEVSGLPDTGKVGTYNVKYTVRTEDGTEAEPVFRTVKVINANLLSQADITSSDSGADYLADGDESTVWTSETDGGFTAEFSRLTIADRFEIIQKGIGISEIELSYSEDGTKWQKLDADISYNGSQITAEFDPTAVKYIRCQIKGANISIGEAGVYAESINVVKADIAELDIADSTSGKDIVLPKKGTYGSTIEWKSSDTDIISDNGSVRTPDDTEEVTMTATVTYLGVSLEKEFEITVKGSGSGKKSSGGGGGGGGGSTVIATVGGEITAPPTDIPLAVSGSYDDVPQSHWAYSYIEELTKAGTVSGVAPRSFEPDRYVTRAEYLKMLLSVVELDESGIDNPFADISDNVWYYEYVIKAYANSIVNGMGDGTFAPDSGIIRQDMAVMTVRALENAGMSTLAGNELNFADTEKISHYAAGSVAALCSIGIIGGDETGRFTPDGLLTRAEAAKVVAMISKII